MKSSENLIFKSFFFVFFCVFSSTSIKLQTDISITQAFFYASTKQKQINLWQADQQLALNSLWQSASPEQPSSIFQDVFSIRRFCLPRRFQEVFKTCLQYIFHKHLQDVLQMPSTRVHKTSSRRFQNVFKTPSRLVRKTSSSSRLEEIFKTSS